MTLQEEFVKLKGLSNYSSFRLTIKQLFQSFKPRVKGRRDI